MHILFQNDLLVTFLPSRQPYWTSGEHIIKYLELSGNAFTYPLPLLANMLSPNTVSVILGHLRLTSFLPAM